MTEAENIEVLKSKHHEIDNKIEAENGRPYPDDIIVADLKRQKLKIKDELASMKALWPAPIHTNLSHNNLVEASSGAWSR